MATKSRKSYQPEEKVAIIRQHLVEGVPVSDLCDRFGMQPTQYYAWQKQFFENGSLVFAQHKGKQRAQKNRYQKKITQLEETIQQKNEVVAELLEEHVQLKKTWGTLNGCWVPHETRDEIVDYVRHWIGKTGIAAKQIVR